MLVQLNPKAEARIAAAANQKGVDVSTVLETLVTEHLPTVEQTPVERRAVTRSVDPENDASIALLETWISQALTNPEEIREAEDEFRDFQDNMNRWRREAGARLIFQEDDEWV